MKNFTLMPFNVNLLGVICATTVAAIVATVPKPLPAFALSPHDRSKMPFIIEVDDYMKNNWLAFFHVTQSYDTHDTEIMSEGGFVCVHKDGTVIWNDAVRDFNKYYPQADRTRTLVNPEQWRQGRISSIQLRDLSALINRNRFFTGEADYEPTKASEASVTRIGAQIGKQKRALSVYGLSAVENRRKQADFERGLYQIYTAIDNLRPEQSQRYKPKTIRVDAFLETASDPNRVVLDWPQTGPLAGITPPQKIESNIRNSWRLQLQRDTNYPKPLAYLSISGKPAEAIINLLSKSRYIRHQGKVYSMDWSPDLPDPL